jgi:hypothetical protein
LRGRRPDRRDVTGRRPHARRGRAGRWPLPARVAGRARERKVNSSLRAPPAHDQHRCCQSFGAWCDQRCCSWRSCWAKRRARSACSGAWMAQVDTPLAAMASWVRATSSFVRAIRAAASLMAWASICPVSLSSAVRAKRSSVACVCSGVFTRSGPSSVRAVVLSSLRIVAFVSCR